MQPGRLFFPSPKLWNYLILFYLTLTAHRKFLFLFFFCLASYRCFKFPLFCCFVWVPPNLYPSHFSISLILSSSHPSRLPHLSAGKIGLHKKWKGLFKRNSCLMKIYYPIPWPTSALLQVGATAPFSFSFFIISLIVSSLSALVFPPRFSYILLLFHFLFAACAVARAPSYAGIHFQHYEPVKANCGETESPAALCCRIYSLYDKGAFSFCPSGRRE